MPNDVKFNVIIPTRERADVLVHCLRTVVAQDYENLEIIVSDNHSNDNTREVVESFMDKRIRYINTGRRLSMSHNWEFALNQVETGWVTYLGDDDGLYPQALRTLNDLIMQHNVEAVSSRYGTFQWPNHFPDSMDGHLRVPLSRSATIRNSEDMLRKALGGKLHYSRLPNLYHGSAATIELVNRSRNQDGKFFCSICPDVYSAVALTSATDTFLSINTPIAVAGVSRHSTGESAAEKKDSARGEPSRVFFSEENIPFHKSLIISKSVQLTLFECYLQSYHIHNGIPKTELSIQLDIAQKAAPKKLSIEIQDSCREIAELNGVTFQKRPSRFWNKARDRISKEFMTVAVRPKHHGLLNVFDACLFSGYLHSLSGHSAPKRINLLAQNLISRSFEKIRRIAKYKMPYKT